MERWYPDELAMAGPEHLNAEFVAGYDRKQQFDPSPDVALLAELGVAKRRDDRRPGRGDGNVRPGGGSFGRQRRRGRHLSGDGRRAAATRARSRVPRT